jgi:hypothetical protein
VTPTQVFLEEYRDTSGTLKLGLMAVALTTWLFGMWFSTASRVE